MMHSTLIPIEEWRGSDASVNSATLQAHDYDRRIQDFDKTAEGFEGFEGFGPQYTAYLMLSLLPIATSKHLGFF